MMDPRSSSPSIHPRAASASLAAAGSGVGQLVDQVPDRPGVTFRRHRPESAPRGADPQAGREVTQPETP